MKKSLLKVITVLFAAFLISSASSETTYAAKNPDLCAKPGCNNKKYCGSYCATHDCCKIKSACKTANYGGRKICKKSGCGNTASSDGYCGRHSSNKSNSNSNSNKKPSNTKKPSSSKKNYDMPDPDDYEDYDDFMDDWDGCMPDGSDAEDYYDNW